MRGDGNGGPRDDTTRMNGGRLNGRWALVLSCPSVSPVLAYQRGVQLPASPHPRNAPTPRRDRCREPCGAGGRALTAHRSGRTQSGDLAGAH